MKQLEVHIMGQNYLLACPGNGEDPRKYRAFRPEYAEATLPDADSE